MEISYVLKDSTFKHHKYTVMDSRIWEHKDLDITLAKGEQFAFQLMIKGSEEFHLCIDKSNVISWKGMKNRVRVDLKTESNVKEKFDINILGYIKDDAGILVNDAILRDKDMLVEAYIPQTLWVEGFIPYDFKDDNLSLTIDLYKTHGYEDEENIASIKVPITIKDVVIPTLNERKFFLDLWQHPSCLARMYKVGLWSDEHFEIIDNYLKDLASMGEKVTTIIASDYPWAGQGCYEIEKNPSNLFEYNMIHVDKDKDGNINCDFSSLDRYISIASKYGMAEELDIFGFLGGWHPEQFGNPVEDYEDPIRVRYFDESDEKFKFIKTAKELGIYITEVCNHLIELGVWDRVRVIADVPKNPELIKRCMEFIDSLNPDIIIKYKTAIHGQESLDKYKTEMNDICVDLNLAANNHQDIKNIKDILNNKDGKFTWFLCCFPEKPNSFLSSPFVENRIISWYTYYFGFDGFLRWDYNLWTENPWENSSYRFPIFKAGDMSFVYPGKDLKPVRSVRQENLRFGIQDFELLTMLEEVKGREFIENEILEDILGRKDSIDVRSAMEVEMNYSLDNEVYNKAKLEILELLQEQTQLSLV